MNGTLFSTAQCVALIELRRAWAERRMVLVGASALACQLEMRWRMTSDLDLTVAVDPGQLEADLEYLGWSHHPRMEQRWTSPDGVLVDLLPASPALLAQGSLTFGRSGHVMNLVGLDLAFTHHVSVPLDATVRLDVATIPVITILKMVSWLDRPSERDRDLEDLAHIFEDYLEPDSLRRWTEPMLDASVSYEAQSALAIGQDVGAIIETSHRALVERFLASFGDDTTAAHAQFSRRFGTTSTSALLVERLEAFRLGLSWSRT